MTERRTENISHMRAGRIEITLNADAAFRIGTWAEEAVGEVCLSCFTIKKNLALFCIVQGYNDRRGYYKRVSSQWRCRLCIARRGYGPLG